MSTFVAVVITGSALMLAEGLRRSPIHERVVSKIGVEGVRHVFGCVYWFLASRMPERFGAAEVDGRCDGGRFATSHEPACRSTLAGGGNQPHGQDVIT
ncbi:hypothetical protein [Micromonospora pallida]|uniref:hypothetical protein n=1 Tax=Micromonospora pallida TaxID=145854 RepID=UPI00114C9ECD|nr:hypothetical protein [Micromonospora pallida]